MTSAENISLIRRFVAVCVRANPDEFADYFTEDATWWNAPWQPIRGVQDIKEAFRRGAGKMKALPWEIRNIVADRDLVMTERVDYFIVGDKTVSVPCMGVFELRDGKIAAWRDYWDLRQFEAQVQSSAEQERS